jgi:hypothetical protein
MTEWCFLFLFSFFNYAFSAYLQPSCEFYSTPWRGCLDTIFWVYFAEYSGLKSSNYCYHSVVFFIFHISSMHSVPISTTVVSSIPHSDKVFLIQFYEINSAGLYFFWVLLFTPPIKLAATIKLKFVGVKRLRIPKD